MSNATCSWFSGWKVTFKVSREWVGVPVPETTSWWTSHQYHEAVDAKLPGMLTDLGLWFESCRSASSSDRDTFLAEVELSWDRVTVGWLSELPTDILSIYRVKTPRDSRYDGWQADLEAARQRRTHVPQRGDKVELLMPEEHGIQEFTVARNGLGLSVGRLEDFYEIMDWRQDRVPKIVRERVAGLQRLDHLIEARRLCVLKPVSRSHRPDEVIAPAGAA